MAPVEQKPAGLFLGQINKGSASKRCPFAMLTDPLSDAYWNATRRSTQKRRARNDALGTAGPTFVYALGASRITQRMGIWFGSEEPIYFAPWAMDRAVVTCCCLSAVIDPVPPPE
jgi:hypothetical protein